jgi:fluoroacetyl-CoA thioesterase
VLPLGELKPGLRCTRTLTVSEALAVPAASGLFGVSAEMPPVFATANMIAFIEWTCVAALAPYLAQNQRTVGTRVEISHDAATPVGMTVTAAVELLEFDDRRLRFAVQCRDEAETIGKGHHERMVIDYDRFMARLARKQTAR